MAQAQGLSDDEDDVVALLATTRSLVNRAHVLALSIDETVAELQEFTDDLARGTVTYFRERRLAQTQYEGEDRRGR